MSNLHDIVSESEITGNKSGMLVIIFIVTVVSYRAAKCLLV